MILVFQLNIFRLLEVTVHSVYTQCLWILPISSDELEVKYSALSNPTFSPNTAPALANLVYRGETLRLLADWYSVSGLTPSFPYPNPKKNACCTGCFRRKYHEKYINDDHGDNILSCIMYELFVIGVFLQVAPKDHIHNRDN